MTATTPETYERAAGEVHVGVYVRMAGGTWARVVRVVPLPGKRCRVHFVNHANVEIQQEMPRWVRLTVANRRPL